MIAFTTYNRPSVLAYSLRKTREVYDGKIIVVDDCSDTKYANQEICKVFDTEYILNSERLGIPRSKELGFMSLLDYDHQFWLDDDCFPKAGWYDVMVDALKIQGHILHLKEWAHIGKKKDYGKVISYTDPTACFMAFDKRTYYEIPGFSLGFYKYGHWHGALSTRLQKYGVDKFVAVKDSSNYIHSFDIDGMPGDFNYSFHSSMSKDERRDELKKYDQKKLTNKTN